MTTRAGSIVAHLEQAALLAREASAAELEMLERQLANTLLDRVRRAGAPRWLSPVVAWYARRTARGMVTRARLCLDVVVEHSRRVRADLEAAPKLRT